MSTHRIGLISDTHGLLRPEVTDALADVEHIIHAGDVGDPNILNTLESIAPVTAVRGNVDFGPMLSDLPITNAIQIGDVSIYVTHIIDSLDIDLKAGGFHAVIFGHTHRPEVRKIDGISYINPGSIGPRRFNLPIEMAYLHINGTHLNVEPITFDL
jgi:putative phosphoesterase